MTSPRKKKLQSFAPSNLSDTRCFTSGQGMASLPTSITSPLASSVLPFRFGSSGSDDGLFHRRVVVVNNYEATALSSIASSIFDDCEAVATTTTATTVRRFARHHLRLRRLLNATHTSSTLVGSSALRASLVHVRPRRLN